MVNANGLMDVADAQEEWKDTQIVVGAFGNILLNQNVNRGFICCGF